MKPTENEHNSYFKKYIDLADDNNLINQLENSSTEFEKFVRQIPHEKVDYKYAENKWTIKQLLIHLIDTERIFSYRALAFCRGEKQNLPGFDENDYADNSKFKHRNLNDIVEEYLAVRQATIQLFKSFDEVDLQKKGVANYSEISINAIGHVLVGHQIHHFKIITERYL
ncbi:MAG: hypothetical protein RL065_1582 [Bacteroidota bacterium]|jgi:uncharacterized damage-inducible protein DinB